MPERGFKKGGLEGFPGPVFIGTLFRSAKGNVRPERARLGLKTTFFGFIFHGTSEINKLRTAFGSSHPQNLRFPRIRKSAYSGKPRAKRYRSGSRAG